MCDSSQACWSQGVLVSDEEMLSKVKSTPRRKEFGYIRYLFWNLLYLCRWTVVIVSAGRYVRVYHWAGLHHSEDIISRCDRLQDAGSFNTTIMFSQNSTLAIPVESALRPVKGRASTLYVDAGCLDTILSATASASSASPPCPRIATTHTTFTT